MRKTIADRKNNVYEDREVSAGQLDGEENCRHLNTVTAIGTMGKRGGGEGGGMGRDLSMKA